MMISLFEKLSNLYYTIQLKYESLLQDIETFENNQRDIEHLKERVTKLEKELDSLKRKSNTLFSSWLQ
jgi:uncharacterized protein Yka (UPF0111/DUF47 family)